jgi:hypothetical protein
MQPSDPFPVERCSPRLQKAILAEFNGRSPTFQDILRIPLEQWLTVPGMGQRAAEGTGNPHPQPALCASGCPFSKPR